MKAFQALLVKDCHTHKKLLLVPVWIILALYLLTLVMIVYAALHNPDSITVGGVPNEFLNNPDLNRMVSFALQAGLFLGFIGLVFAIPTAISGSILLNGDIKGKCELFHRSQPVSVWQVTASRFIVGIGGMLALALGIGLLQYLAGNLLLVIFTPLRVDWWLSLNGMLLGWAHLSVSLLVLGSVCFLLSSVFKDNAFGKGALVLAAVELAVHAANYFLKAGIPSPFGLLRDLVMSNLRDFTHTFPTMQYGIQFNHKVSGEAAMAAFQIPSRFLGTLWSSLFSWGVALKLFASALLYTLATCLYQRREVQF